MKRMPLAIILGLAFLLPGPNALCAREKAPLFSLPELESGEQVSLELRDRLFERGENIADPAILQKIASAHGLRHDPNDLDAPKRDHAEGVERGVIGSPHFFTPAGSFFCPALNVGRDEAGHLVVTPDVEGFEAFLASCFS